jgi:hypothetical protein
MQATRTPGVNDLLPIVYYKQDTPVWQDKPVQYFKLDDAVLAPVTRPALKEGVRYDAMLSVTVTHTRSELTVTT